MRAPDDISASATPAAEPPGPSTRRAGPPALRFTPKRAVAVLALLSAVALVALWASLSFGEYPLHLFSALAHPGSMEGRVLFSLRLPRALLAALVGAALATSGCALQALLRNPLADPFILGVSGGAAMGATLAIALGLTVVVQLAAPSLFAFIGALGATALVFVAGRVRGKSSPYAALLSGVVFNAFAAAAITCVKTLSAPDKVGELLYWLAGTLGYERFSTLAFCAALQGVSIGVIWAISPSLNLLTLGDEDAAALGVPVERTKAVVLGFTSLSVAGAVALSGLVGFVGLIVPHVLRLWLGPDHRLLIPASCVGGAAFLMLADLLTRLLFPVFHAEPPVGVVTAALGGPLFLWLLRRGGRQVV